jgi:cytochrome P450
LVDINIHRELTAWTLDVIGVVAFGNNFNNIEQNSPFAGTLEEIFNGIEKRVNIPKKFWKWALKDNETFFHNCETLQNFTRDIIEQRRKDMSINISADDEKGKKDLLQRLLGAKTEEGNTLTEEQIVTEVTLIFVS